MFLDKMEKYLNEDLDIDLNTLLNTDKAYEILDGSKAKFTTWCAGGCAILAFALNKLYNYPIYVLYNNNKDVVEHFVVKSNNKYIDCDGLHLNIINDFKKRELVKDDLELIKYDPKMNIGDIVIDKKAINKLIKYLKNN